MRLNLITLREELTTGLEAEGLTVYDHLPPQLHPPVVMIEPGAPYITEATNPNLPYGWVSVNWTAHVVAKAGTPATQTLDLDALIVQTLYAIPEGWEFVDISQPYTLTDGQRSWLATRIDISKEARL